MFKPGFVSVCFRGHSPKEILEAAKAAGASVIEWGSDVHAPIGDVKTAKEIAALSREYGIEISSYGSYFRLSKNDVSEFPGVIASAEALGVKIIRIWGCGYIEGFIGEAWDKAVADVRLMCDMAKTAGMKLCLECHNDSITEDYVSALAFFNAVNHPAFGLYWQMNERRDVEYNIEAARAMAPYVECIHTFYYEIGSKQLPLEKGIEPWKKYLALFRELSPKKEIPMLLEFMHDGRIETLAKETESLKKLIASLDFTDAKA